LQSFRSPALFTQELAIGQLKLVVARISSPETKAAEMVSTSEILSQTFKNITLGLDNDW
jgi:hypothetical protein